jgi:zinc transporter ZupT
MIPSVVYDAFYYALLSGLSFPLGAILGIFLSPVSPYVVALIIAFGAGALLFAVTVELYGEQLKHLEEHGHHHEGMVEVGICLGMAMVGAILYMFLSRYVETLSEGPEEKKSEVGSVSAMESGINATPRDNDSSSIAGSSPEQTPRGEDGEIVREHKTLRQDSKWKKGRQKVLLAAKLNKSVLEQRRSKFKVEQMAMAAQHGDSSATTLAFGMFVGVLADGLPEAVLMGFLASAGKLSFMFVLSLFVANFPESFGSGSILYESKTFSPFIIVAMWTIPCVLAAVLAALTCYLVPEDVQGLPAVEMVAASIEGLAGGMMMAMIGSMMLPEAFNMAKKSENIFNKMVAEHHHHHGADIPGVLCVAGFLVAVGMKVTGGYLGSSHAAEAHHGGGHHGEGFF